MKKVLENTELISTRKFSNLYCKFDFITSQLPKIFCYQKFIQKEQKTVPFLETANEAIDCLNNY